MSGPFLCRSNLLVVVVVVLLVSCSSFVQEKAVDNGSIMVYADKDNILLISVYLKSALRGHSTAEKCSLLHLQEVFIGH